MNSRVYSAVERYGGAEKAEMMSLPPPWKCVTSEQVREAIGGSLLEPVVEVLESVTKPPLPLEITLPKAIALAGTCLSQPVEDYNPEDTNDKRRGVELAKLRISTAGGQVCNAYVLIVGASGAGKDVGYVAEKMAGKLGYLVGTSGSPEGLADAFIENGAGLLVVSEFSPWLDPHHWQHKTASWITDAWSKGWFNVRLSKRQRSMKRESGYCYPSLIAGIQPEILAEEITSSHLDSGFLNRFLISRVKDTQRWRPGVKSPDIGKAMTALQTYGQVKGTVDVLYGYLGDLWDEFENYEAPLRGYWSRLVNEYGARIAVMLAYRPGAGETPRIDPEHWGRAAIILRWFFAMAEDVLGDIDDDKASRKRENDYRRFYRFIEGRGPVTKSDISHYMHRGTNKKYREMILEELEERGWVRHENGKYYAIPGSLPG